MFFTDYRLGISKSRHRDVGGVEVFYDITDVCRTEVLPAMVLNSYCRLQTNVKLETVNITKVLKESEKTCQFHALKPGAQ